MYIKLAQNENDKFYFSVVYADKEIFKSTDPIFPFSGEYGEYDSFDVAKRNFKRFAFINSHLLTKISDLESTESSDFIKTRVIDNYSTRLNQFIQMLDRIDPNERGKIRERVKNIRIMVDQFAKSMFETIREIENDERVNEIPESVNVQQIGYEELESPYSKQIYLLKKKLKKFYKKLKKKFRDYLDVSASGCLTDILTAGDSSWMKEVLYEFADSSIESLGLEDLNVRKIERSDSGFEIFLSCNNGSLILSFNNNLLLTGIHPYEGFIETHPHMSQQYYNDLWLPVFKAVGNYMVDENHIIFPEQDSNVRVGYTDGGKYLKDRFEGFDTRDNSKIYANVFLIGKDSNNRSCMFSTAISEKEKNMLVELENQKKTLVNAQAVTCVETGTKYDGKSGKVIADKIAMRNGYFEVPVSFVFDNGAEETVIFVNGDLKVLL